MTAAASTRLDTRRSLYGELRLSDAQVRALRAAAAGGLIDTSSGYAADDAMHRPAVVHGRALQYLLDRTPDGLIVASPRGHSVLAAIDASKGGA